ISFNRQLELPDLIGEKDLKDGSTTFVDGVLTKAIQTNALIVFDEYSRATAAITLGLQRFTDTGELFIAGRFGEGQEESDVDFELSDVVTSHPDMNLCVCDNTLGLGDDMDKYAAANVQDVSTLNRWEINVQMDYLPRGYEEEFILEQQPEMPKDVAKKLSQVSELFHQGFKQGGLAVPFSMRNLKVVAKLTMQLRDPVKALEWNYINSLDDDSKVVAREFINTVFGH
ncbi:MAG: AAA family ATPase, partial [Methanosarcinales archaeon]